MMDGIIPLAWVVAQASAEGVAEADGAGSSPSAAARSRQA